MILYSQHDPAFQNLTLGQSHLTVGGFGCFLCSLATIYQRSPQSLLSIPNAVTPEGLLIASVIASNCGGEALPATNVPPQGWCIAQTDHYAPLGFSTHFFVCNPQANQMVDPLKFPALIEPISYHIVNYRPFTKIAFGMPQQVIAPNVAGLERRLTTEKNPTMRAMIVRLIARLLRVNP